MSSLTNVPLFSSYQSKDSQDLIFNKKNEKNLIDLSGLAKESAKIYTFE